ncbi:MAG TPA: outer membrane beta-barrel protein [Candidatus Acidoferrales bacterium]|nr:outer membrane beta-barrel protein [Candidatus Acidoferrales bacterium]
MRKRLSEFLAVIFFSCFAALGPAGAAEESKGLPPGWLSLDGSVGVVDNAIQSGKASLESALGIKIGGYLDTSYTWSSNHPKSPRNISYRYFDKDHNKIVFNDFHVAIEKPEKDWGVGFKISGDFGRTGELLREATFWGPGLRKEPSAELREAYLTATIPIGEGIGVKGGLFVTTLGTEILLNPGAYNDNISRSFLFNFAIPLRHLGVLFSYPLLKTLTVTAGPVTGWDNPHDTNNQPSFLGGVTWAPVDWFTLASNVVAGAEQPRNNHNDRVVVSNVATIKPMDPLTLYLEYTWGNEGGAGGHWNGWAAIASYNWTERFNTALRGEIMHDKGGSRLGFKDQDLGEVTLTAAYKFTSQLLGRFEVRQDWAGVKSLKKGCCSLDKNQTTLAVQAIYGF